MSRTRANYFSSNNQPQLAIKRLLQLDLTIGLLASLQGQTHTLSSLCDGDAQRIKRLRQLCQVNLVTAYQLSDTWYYRARKYPPYVAELMAADVAKAA